MAIKITIICLVYSYKNSTVAEETRWKMYIVRSQKNSQKRCSKRVISKENL